ncbi:MAG: hypothetical protein DRO94_02085 [Candidatus Altiarchaeales archaeon]|nr:MAG: hypothetical protein DRO95_01070 [Candidatus Altiarchaeales archaeon]RLI94791.1 MAG: hypothetical protein DRO94_02085 [Candidatus Altiarchaeales archaeon]HDO82212.1 hypothetical protein [Candidatus Altiarchaeales archaeon]HEX54861.1 hypothetical protein [Candidatus Altiarchaeales archaeon]
MEGIYDKIPWYKLERLEGKVTVEFHVREGEYGPVCRFEFPSNEHIFRLLSEAPLEERKRFNFYLFDNILVAHNYSEDVFDFLQRAARNVGFEIEFKERERGKKGGEILESETDKTE